MTREEVYSKIVASEELIRRYQSITDRGALEAFLSEHGVETGGEADYVITEASRYASFLSASPTLLSSVSA